MKKIFKIFGYLIVFLIALLVVLAAWIKFTDLPTYEVKNVDITLPTDSASIYQGGRIVETMCAYCHRSEDDCLLYTSPSPRDRTRSRMPSSA